MGSLLTTFGTLVIECRHRGRSGHTTRHHRTPHANKKKVNLLSKLTFVPRIGLEAQCHRHKLARIHY